MKTSLQKPSQPAWQIFCQWARGAMPTSSADGLNGKVRRGLAEATRPQSAQSILEFLLVSVPLLAIIFGTLEFGLAFFKATQLDYVTREVARATALCGADCDQPPDSTAVLYRDYYGLRVISNTSMLNPPDIEYILMQHVGEQDDVPTVGQFNYGRVGPDTYANYPSHYQLYAYPKQGIAAPRGNGVPPRASDPRGIIFNDANKTQIPLLAGVGSMPNYAYNTNYNGWRSAKCTSEVTTDCRHSIPKANADGSAAGGTPYPKWAGRYACVPTDRFYVQIALKHYWITPFMPTINTDGRSQGLRGWTAEQAIVLSSKVYQKVEPQLYAQTADGCAN